MAGSAPHIPDDDIEAAAQRPAQDENAPAKGDERSLSDKAESIPKLPEDHMEATAQQALPAENAPAGGDRSSHRNELPKLTYNQMLCRFAYKVRAGSRLANASLNFDNLSRINIIHLMNELAKCEQAIRKNDAAPQDIEHLEDLLHRYTTAVQDRAYWSKLSKFGTYSHKVGFNRLLQEEFPKIYRDFGDVETVDLDESFRSKSVPADPLRNFLNRIFPAAFFLNQEDLRRGGANEFMLVTSPRKVFAFVDNLARFIVAITGGLSLVIPMLIMRLGETLAKSLTTVSVAVVLFSALTSLMFKASNVETLGATAAYAAVLVVFVGTSG